jgi:hypothetical protein
MGTETRILRGAHEEILDRGSESAPARRGLDSAGTNATWAVAMSHPDHIFRRIGRGRKKLIPPLGPGPVLFFVVLILAAAIVDYAIEAALR